MRLARLLPALRRHLTTGPPPLVRHGTVRQSQQVAGAPRPPRGTRRRRRTMTAERPIERPGCRPLARQGAQLPTEKGESYETGDGIAGELRSYRPGDRVRLTRDRLVRGVPAGGPGLDVRGDAADPGPDRHGVRAGVRAADDRGDGRGGGGRTGAGGRSAAHVDAVRVGGRHLGGDGGVRPGPGRVRRGVDAGGLPGGAGGAAGDGGAWRGDHAGRAAGRGPARGRGGEGGGAQGDRGRGDRSLGDRRRAGEELSRVGSGL